MKTLKTLLLLVFSTGIVFAQDDAPTAASTYNDGLAKLKAKEYTAAYDLLMQAIELADPEEDAQVLRLAKGNGSISAYYAGNDALKAENYEDAMMKFEKGLELNPKSYTCAYGIAKTYDDQDMTTDAVNAYLKAAEVATAAGKADRAERYTSRAGNIVGLAMGDDRHDDAVAAGEAFLAAQDDKDVRYYVAKSLIAKGMASDALAHAEKAVELGGVDAEEGKYQMLLAETLEATGNKAAAAEAYGKVPAGKYAQVAKYKATELVK